MDTSVISGPDRWRICRRRGPQAFSLVEVALALGIVAFAFVTLLGMIPVGLNTFRNAIDASVGSQIVQHVVNDAQQTDFNTLTTGATASTSATPYSTRYFDDQGNELLLATDFPKALYVVKSFVTLASVPGDTYLSDPANNTSQSPAGLSNLAVVSLQIANVAQPNAPTLASGLVSRNQPAGTP